MKKIASVCGALASVYEVLTHFGRCVRHLLVEKLHHFLVVMACIGGGGLICHW